MEILCWSWTTGIDFKQTILYKLSWDDLISPLLQNDFVMCTVYSEEEDKPHHRDPILVMDNWNCEQVGYK